jgi:8-hydroxy-5-deazaflavin:NADPH oxidoreductase
MKIGILGSGTVGTTLGGKLTAVGHEVRIGSRTADNEKAAEWVKQAGERASQGTFADAASFGEVVFNCTLGAASLEALQAAGADALRGKILLDTSNPLDFSKGMPPSLFTGNTDSLGEQIQRAFPETKVVKTLNTVSAHIMIEPARVGGGEHDMFLCGNDPTAKARVTSLLREWFGWKHVVDLGDISTARGTESYLALWVRMWGAVGSPDFNIHIVR